MAKNKKDYNVSEITKEVQSSYDFLRQGSNMLPTSEVELSDRFYGLLQELEDLKEELELLEEDE